MTDLSHLSLRELAALSVDVHREIRGRQPRKRTCVSCGKRFAARSDARYCSVRCRVAAHRIRQRKERNVEITGIGYEGITLEDFVSTLSLRGTKTLVDVRLNAISRKRGFSKRALSEALAEAGILYVHMPALGNQRGNRAGYAEIDSEFGREARDRFRAVLTLDAASTALGELAELARGGDVVVFCFEREEQHCHREQVLDEVRRLLRRDLAVV